MKRISLSEIAGEFETISDEHQLFYNFEIGEFDFYIDPIYSGAEDDYERFEAECWISCPSQRDLREYFRQNSEYTEHRWSPVPVL